MELIKGLILCLFACLLLWASAARADGELPRVVVLTDPSPMSMLGDALIRVRGELAAAGLQAELHERRAGDSREYKPDAGVYGVLAFEQLGPVILIRAFGPATHTPLTESVDTQSSAVNAEVLAVRAVETLRAAMVQQGDPRDTGDVPDAVKNFARPQPAEPKPETAEPAPEKRPAPARDTDKPPAPTPNPPPKKLPEPRTRALIGWLGAGLALEPNARASSHARLGALLGPSWGFVAASFETSLAPLTLSEPAGDARISARAGSLALGARLRVLRELELFTHVAAGYAWYDVQGGAESGYVAQHLRPRSAFTALGVSSAYWLSDSLAVALELGSRIALDAPRVRVAGSDLVALDRPSFDAGLSLLASVF